MSIVFGRSRILRTKEDLKTAFLLIYLKHCNLRNRIGNDCLVRIENNDDTRETRRNCTILSLSESFWKGATEILFCLKNPNIDSRFGLTGKELVDYLLEFNWLFASYPQLCHALVTYEEYQSALKRVFIYCRTVSSIRLLVFLFFFLFF